MLAAARTTRDNAAVRLHRAPAAPATPAYEPELGRVLRVAHLAALADQRGYLGTRLHRSTDGSHFRFVDLARWSSPLMFARATQRPEFRAAADASRFAALPALYSVVRG
jgi:heme-degrading monooxygenase HmoA